MYMHMTSPMHKYKAFLNSLGFLISEMTGRNADVPELDTKMVAVAVIPSRNDGYAITW